MMTVFPHVTLTPQLAPGQWFGVTAALDPQSAAMTHNAAVEFADDTTYLHDNVTHADMAGDAAGFEISLHIVYDTLPSVLGHAGYSVYHRNGSTGYTLRGNSVDDKLIATLNGFDVSLDLGTIVAGTTYHVIMGINDEGDAFALRNDDTPVIASITYTASTFTSLDLGTLTTNATVGRISTFTYLDANTTAAEKVLLAAGITGAEIAAHPTLNTKVVDHWDFNEITGTRTGLNERTLIEVNGATPRAAGAVSRAPAAAPADTVASLTPTVGDAYLQADITKRLTRALVNGRAVLSGDGTQDLDAGSAKQIEGTTAWTVLGAVRKTGADAYSVLGGSDTANETIGLDASEQLFYRDAAGVASTHTYVTTLNTWTFFWVRNNADGTVDIGVRGQGEEGFSVTTGNADLRYDTIGSANDTAKIVGDIADVPVYARALTGTEIDNAIDVLANSLGE